MTQKVPARIQKWIEENKTTLQPPIGNRQFWKDSGQNLLVMIVEAGRFTRPVVISGDVIHADCGPLGAIGASFT